MSDELDGLVKRMRDAAHDAETDTSKAIWDYPEMLRSAAAALEALRSGPVGEAARLNEMADRLIAMRAHKCLLTTDQRGWPDGLSVPLNDPDTGDREQVAHLDLEDSGFGPILWDFAISSLKARALAETKEVGDG